MGKSSGMTPMQKRVAEQRKQQQAKDRRIKIIFAVVAVAVVAIAAIVIGILMSKSSDGDSGANSAAAIKIEKDVQAKYGDGQPIQLGDKGTKISLYYDYTCPHCAETELLVGPELMKQVDSGKATLLLHPVSTVNLPYNSAATAAVLRTSIAQPDKLQKFHEQLLDNFINKLKSNGVDLFRDPQKALQEVRDVAKKVGVSDSTLAGLAINSGDSYLQKSSQAWVNANIKGTSKDQMGTPMFVRVSDNTVVPLKVPFAAPAASASAADQEAYNQKVSEYLRTTWVKDLISGKK